MRCGLSDRAVIVTCSERGFNHAAAIIVIFAFLKGTFKVRMRGKSYVNRLP